ncbi:hsp70-binding protein 1-like isoform X2 [Homarus americanus]|uniref:hsp70-binding protein 1-like isoform X2 n=1 Tax=Homarus americanus TaxID=6706 RepID=UPI001C475E83|nr:hsp70-binding protein 1-like isoform X2 [Homarus americanus]
MSDRQENEEPRQPRNLQGLLNFCTEITAREDTTGPSQLQTMDPERRAFLEEALTSMAVDGVKEMAKAVKSLYSESITMPGEDISKQKEAMAILEEYVDDLNYAMDLHKMGGYPILVQCLNSPHTSLRIGAATLIGDICQNYLYCQENMLALDIMPVLLLMLDTDEDTQARVKALYAISCVVRDCPKGEAEFLDADGLSYLMRAMQSGVEKLVIKSAFLLTKLVKKKDSNRAVSMGFVEQLLTVLGSEKTDNISREHCTDALRTLALTYPPALAECLRPELNVSQILTSRLDDIKEKEETQEEECYIKEILELMERGSIGDSDESTNR